MALVVEDAAGTAQQFAHYLRVRGVTAVIHPRAAGAVESVRRLQLDVVILDLLVPDGTGWEVLQELQADAALRQIPVIVISVEDERARGRAAGVVEYLVKPITSDQFAQALAAAAHAPRQAVVIAPARRPAGARLLLAEDNDVNILPLADYLEDLGYEVLVARTGREAVDLAHKTQPALILMDIQMPDMDGLEATRRLRAHPKTACTPILALTALALPGDRERCLAAGATEYLTKPVSLKALRETVHHWLPNPE